MSSICPLIFTNVSFFFESQVVDSAKACTRVLTTWWSDSPWDFLREIWWAIEINITLLLLFMIFQEIRGILASFIEIILESLGLFGEVIGESIDILQRTRNSGFQSVGFKVNSFKYVCIHSIKIIKLIETQYLINILFYYYSLGFKNKTLYWRWKGIQRKLG